MIQEQSVNGEQSASHILETWWRTGRRGSDAHRLIVRYLEEHYRQAAFMTSAELAAAVGVSQASVSRFASSLGYSGYAEWNKQMQQIIRRELSAAERLWFAANPASEEGDRVLQSELRNLEQLDRVARSDAFSQFARLIVDAERVLLVSARASATLLPYAQYFLGKVRPHVYSASPGTGLWDQLCCEDSHSSLIVAIAFPRYPKALMDLLRQLNERRFAIAALTDHPASPVSAYARHTLVAPVTTASLFDSYAAPITLLNLLIREVARLSPDRSEERLRMLEENDQLTDAYYS